MGDVRFSPFYTRVLDADDPAAEIRALSDEGVIAALAAASVARDAYLANVLATEAMNRAEQKETIMTALAEGVYAVDTEGRTTFVNPAAARALGWRDGALLGRSAHEMLHADEPSGPALNRECPHWGALALGDVVREAEGAFRRRDGTVFPVSYTCAPILREGEIVGAVVAFRDVTERRRAEDALRETHETLRSVIEASPLAIYTLDADARVTTWNPAAARLLGWSAAETVGRVPPIAPADDPAEFDALRARVLAGEVIQGIEVRRVRRDGEPVDLRVSVAPLHDASGGTNGLVAILEDVTEKRRVEETLRYQTSLLEAQNEASPDAILVVDERSRMLSWNQRFLDLWEFPEEIVLSRSDGAALEWAAERTTDPPGFLARVRSLYAERPASSRDEVLLADGRVLDRHGAAVVGPDGRYYGWVWSFRDVTSAKRADSLRLARLAVAESLAGARSSEAALSRALTALGESLAWRIGEAWLPEARDGRLRCVATWAAPGVHAERFGQAARGTTFAPGEGLQGLAASTGRPVGVRDFAADPRFPRAAAAAAANLHSAFAFPIPTGNGTFGAVTFFTAEVRDIDEDLLETVATVGSQLGLFLDRKREEEARLRLAAVVESSADAITLVDPAGVVTAWNPGAERLFGYAVEEAVGKPLDALMPAESEGETAALLARVKAGERLGGVESRRRARDGRAMDVSLSLSPVRDSEGRVVAVAAIARDVSEQKGLEHALRASEQRYRELFENLPSIYLAVDTEGQIRFVNEYGAEHLGYRPEDLVGRAATSLFHPHDRPEAERRFREFMEDPERVAHWDFRKVRKDGSIVWVRESIRGIVAPDGAAGALIFCEDVTDEKLARAKLEESEERHRSLFQYNPDAVYSFDLAGNFLAANPALSEMSGYGEDELLRISFLPLVAPEDRDETYRRFRLAGEGNPQTYDSTLLTKSGDRKRVTVTNIPIVVGGEIVGVFGVAKDVTARRRAEEEAKRLNERLEERVSERTRDLTTANRELEAFSYSVSHDLRAPLRGIGYFSQILEEDYGERLDEQGREYVARIRSEERRLTRLVNDLLQLSRVGSGAVERERTDVTAMAEDVASRLAEAAPKRSVAWRVERGLVADADPRLLRVVLENLIGNAWKFTRDAVDPRVEVGAVPPEEEGGSPVFFVKDNGAGFDMAKAGRLFAPFERLHDGSTFEGTGVGLATVQRVVERHGGRVWAEGRLGEGATFYFTL